jgi:hypothetical protein
MTANWLSDKKNLDKLKNELMKYGYACGNGHGKDMTTGSKMKINDAT